MGKRANRGGGREAQDAAGRAGGVEDAEPFRPGVQDVAGQARQEHLVREPEDLGAGGERDQHEHRPIAPDRGEELHDAPPQRHRLRRRGRTGRRRHRQERDRAGEVSGGHREIRRAGAVMRDQRAGAE